MSFFKTDERARRIGEALERRTLADWGPQGLANDKFAFTLLVHDRPLTGPGPHPEAPNGYARRGGQSFYPCSVVKVFFLVAALQCLKDGTIQPHDDLTQAMRDIISVSSNAGTNYIIDLVTGTTGETLLPPAEMAAWREKRHWVNRYFASWGWPEFADINLTQKLTDEVRYGREREFVGNGANHNRLSTDATARLFHAVFTGRAIDAEASRIAVDHLWRPIDPKWIEEEPRSQILGYFGEGLPKGSRLWSKAGRTVWTGDPTASFRRHDAAYVELPTGQAFTLVAFTEGQSINDVGCLPAIARTAAELVAGA